MKYLTQSGSGPYQWDFTVADLRRFLAAAAEAGAVDADTVDFLVDVGGEVYELGVRVGEQQ